MEMSVTAIQPFNTAMAEKGFFHAKKRDH